MPRYILNKKSKLAHDQYALTERCNTDSIEPKVRADSLPPGYRLCVHCERNRP